MTLALPAKASSSTRSLLGTISYADIFELCSCLDDGSVDMILCDLPYGTTACTWDTVIPFAPMWEQFKRVIKPRGAVVLTASGKFSYQLVMSNFEWFRYEIIAEKDGVTGHLNANRQPLKAHEAVCVFYQKHPTYNPQLIPGKEYSATSGAAGGYIRDKNTGGYTTVNTGYRYPRSVIKFNWPINLMHPTQKPVALFEYLIRTYTNAVDVVFDPCCGSGTTAVAAWRSERRFICGDNNLEYVQVARKRLVEADPYNPKQIGDKVQMSLFAGLKND